MDAAHVVVVVPNRDGKHHLEYSIPRLVSTCYPNYEIIVVDNRSSDSSVEFLVGSFPDIHVCKNEVDRGFAGGVNVGIRLALQRKADYIAVFSNDIKVLPNWLSVGSEILEVNPQAGVLGYTELARGEEAKLVMPDHIEWAEVGARLPGPLYLCRAEVFSAVGLFDEEYFMYGEENDLFARVKRAGFLILQTNIPVWHYMGGYTSKAPLKVAWLAFRNGIRYSIKNDTPASVLRQIVALLYFGTVPFSKLPTIHAKLRPSIGIVNACIWFVAVLWNLVHIFSTLRSRREDDQRIRLHVDKTKRGATTSQENNLSSK